MKSAYDPFARGPFPVGERTFDARDDARERTFRCEQWYPASSDARDAAARPGSYPLILFSHHSGGGRRAATYLCSHLSSHGYVVAALDHSEVVAAELIAAPGESASARAKRIEGWIASRVPDVRFLLGQMLEHGERLSQARIDPARVGIVGHSFGGWTALAAVADETRIRAVVALAPAGSTHPEPGILAVSLPFGWEHAVPVLYIAAENDTSLPLAGMRELFGRNPEPKRLVVLRGADHLHFLDDAERQHEALRGMTFSGDLAWLPGAMRPFAELLSSEKAKQTIRGLTVAHFDATLRNNSAARRLFENDIADTLPLD